MSGISDFCGVQKPGLARGTRDHGPAAMVRRQYVFEILRKNFQLFGFQPLETPAMENLQTLTGKYGEEGDRLIFTILNSGDYLKELSLEEMERARNAGSKPLTAKIAEKALRYDLTIPFARYVAMNHGTLSFPFRRYQMQPVWRADRPQKGRYREFYQCDADIIGSTSRINEAELVMLYQKSFSDLGFRDFSIRINHRKILQALAEISGAGEFFTAFVTILDKWDKIGEEKVRTELEALSPEVNPGKIWPVLMAETLNFEALIQFFAENSNEIGSQGLKEVQEVFDFVGQLGGSSNSLVFDLKLARGLDYYTGCVFEVVTHETEMGSLGGGGRYDDLTGIFGLKNMSGVGISFGFERILDVMETLNLFSNLPQTTTQVLISGMDEVSHRYLMPLVGQLRQLGISVEFYPEVVKFKKVISYADQRHIPFLLLAGEDEVKEGVVSIRDMQSGQQVKRKIEEIGKADFHSA